VQALTIRRSDSLLLHSMSASAIALYALQQS